MKVFILGKCRPTFYQSQYHFIQIISKEYFIDIILYMNISFTSYFQYYTMEFNLLCKLKGGSNMKGIDFLQA